MKAIVGELDQCGLRRLLPAETDAKNALERYARARLGRPTAFVWALLRDEEDAEAVRVNVGAGRHGEACSLLLTSQETYPRFTRLTFCGEQRACVGTWVVSSP